MTWKVSRSGRSTVIWWYPKSLLSNIFDRPFRVTSPYSRTISAMLSSDSSLRLLPRLLRIFTNRSVALMSWTLPRRSLRLRLVTTQM